MGRRKLLPPPFPEPAILFTAPSHPSPACPFGPWTRYTSAWSCWTRGVSCAVNSVGSCRGEGEIPPPPLGPRAPSPWCSVPYTSFQLLLGLCSAPGQPGSAGKQRKWGEGRSKQCLSLRSFPPNPCFHPLPCLSHEHRLGAERSCSCCHETCFSLTWGGEDQQIIPPFPELLLFPGTPSQLRFYKNELKSSLSLIHI